MLKAARASDIVAPLAVLGAFTAIKGFCGLSSALFKTFLRPGKDLRKRGEWAIITGASDGIGKAYALELAKKGLRTIEKLEAAANEIKQACPEVTVQCLAVDFNSFDAEAQAMISSSLCGKDIGVLINNVGYTAPPLHLQYLSMAQINSLVQVNLMSTVLMTQAVLPAMTQQGRGAIVNTASGFGCMPSPLFSLYGATKAAIIRLSGALAVELEGKGISVQCQVPCMVATKMGGETQNWLKPSPQVYVKAAVRSIGYECVVVPYWSHKLQVCLMGQAPFTSARLMYKGLSKTLEEE